MTRFLSEYGDAESRLARLKDEVDRELERILAGNDSPLFGVMRYAVLEGGKRYRPLLLLSAGMCFGAESQGLLPFACAVELIHNYSLVHDDLPLLDNDDLRRGKPSCHRAFGADAALLAGDGLLTLAFEVMAGASLPPSFARQRDQAVGEIARSAGVKGMIEGQYADIRLCRADMSERAVLELMAKKTGALIAGSVRTGAILGQASPPELEALSEYGRKIGLAFQVRDDILDAEDAQGEGGPFRPNFARLLGPQKAGERLRSYVRTGLKALEEAALESRELSCLGLRLLDVVEERE